MTDPTEHPDFMLLVPVGSEDLTQLLGNSPEKIDAHLSEWGVRSPVARVNLGMGRMASFGIGAGPVPNPRAQEMLTQWGRLNIVVGGPVVFSGISAAQAMALVRIASLHGVQEVLT